MDHNTLASLHSYTYEEITTFGGSNDDGFMLVVSPLSQQLKKTVTGGQVQSEKLVFSMPKLKVRCCSNISRVTALGKYYIIFTDQPQTPSWKCNNAMGGAYQPMYNIQKLKL